MMFTVQYRTTISNLISVGIMQNWDDDARLWYENTMSISIIIVGLNKQALAVEITSA